MGILLVSRQRRGGGAVREFGWIPLLFKLDFWILGGLSSADMVCIFEFGRLFEHSIWSLGSDFDVMDMGHCSLGERGREC